MRRARRTTLINFILSIDDTEDVTRADSTPSSLPDGPPDPRASSRVAEAPKDVGSSFSGRYGPDTCPQSVPTRVSTLPTMKGVPFGTSCRQPPRAPGRSPGTRATSSSTLRTGTPDRHPVDHTGPRALPDLGRTLGDLLVCMVPAGYYCEYFVGSPTRVPFRSSLSTPTSSPRQGGP